MRLKRILNIASVLLLSLSFLLFIGCGKDEVPGDPSDTVTLNMLNEQNGKTLLGTSDVYINKSNNFYTSRSFISDAGSASGVGVKIELRLGNLVQEAAVLPGHVYHIYDNRTIRDFPSGTRAVQVGAGFYQVYVVSPIMTNDVLSGALVKYVLAYPDLKGLPEFEHELGDIHNAGESIEMVLPQNAECVFDEHYGSGEKGAFEVSTVNGKLTITLKKSPNSISGPYGLYRTYIRSGNVFTTVIFNVL